MTLLRLINGLLYRFDNGTARTPQEEGRVLTMQPYSCSYDLLPVEEEYLGIGTVTREDPVFKSPFYTHEDFAQTEQFAKDLKVSRSN